MIQDPERCQKCKEFLDETAQRDGYTLIRTLSKHESLNRICEFYKKMAYLMGRGDHQYLRLRDESQRINVRTADRVDGIRPRRPCEEGADLYIGIRRLLAAKRYNNTCLQSSLMSILIYIYILCVDV